MARSKAKVECPAGREVGNVNGPESGCHCTIAEDTLMPHENPQALRSFCKADYTECPTWRTFKEAEWAKEDHELRRAVERTAGKHRPVAV